MPRINVVAKDVTDDVVERSIDNVISGKRHVARMASAPRRIRIREVGVRDGDVLGRPDHGLLALINGFGQGGKTGGKGDPEKDHDPAEHERYCDESQFDDP